jgi:hypothetical protein
MELLHDVGHVQSRFGLLETLFVSVQDRCTVCAKHTIGSKSFWMHPMELLGDVGHVEPQFGLFEDSVSVGAK